MAVQVPLLIGLLAAVEFYGAASAADEFRDHFLSETKDAYNEAYGKDEGYDPVAQSDAEYEPFRHAYTSAKLTQYLGADAAKLIMDGNEFVGGNSEADRRMDYYNNDVGAELFGEYEPSSDFFEPDYSLGDSVKQAIDSGDLKISPSQIPSEYDHLSFFEGLAQSIVDAHVDILGAVLDFVDNLNLGDVDSDVDGRNDSPPGSPPTDNLPEPPPEPPELPRTPWLPDWFPSWIRDWIPDLKISPLTLDLDGDGIELYQLGEYGSYFDLEASGQAVLTGWVSPDDGLLSYDVNSNGEIDDITELFGNGSNDGFSMLSAYDSNDDGVIDQNDLIFTDLLVWTDLNSDGQSQNGELHSLIDLGIASISLNADRVLDQEIAGNQITHAGTYTLLDGSERNIVDAWFNYDSLLTRNNDEYSFDIRVAFLPTLKGYGHLKDLYIASSIDNGSDPSSLIEQLSALESSTVLANAFSAWDSIKSSTEDIMYRWAGIESVDPVSRGSYVDAQHLAFYEAFRGYEFSQYGKSNPGPQAGKLIEGIYDFLHTLYTVQLTAQMVSSELFTDAYYDSYYGMMRGDLTLLQSGIDAVRDDAIAASDTAGVWTGFAQLLGYTIGLDNLTAEEVAALDTAVLASGDASLADWGDVVTAMESTFGPIIDSSEYWENLDATYENVINGTSGDDVIVDDNAYGNINNELRGHDGSDTLSGLDGYDLLEGGAGGDTLIGGLGDDVLIGGTGNDVYVYEAGNDTISEEDGGGVDEIRIAASTGLTEANMTLYRQGDELNLLFDNGNFITIDGYNTANGRIEKIIFEVDGTELDLTSLTHETFYGTDEFDVITASGSAVQTMIVYGYEGNDRLEVSQSSGELHGGDGYDTLIGDYLNDNLYGDAKDDYLVGNGGNDLLIGGAGRDWLFGGDDNDTLMGGDEDDFLDGGAGDDVLKGGDGSDTYYFGIGDGNDFIERGLYNTDEVVFKDGLLATDVSVAQRSNGSSRGDLTLIIDSTGETLKIEDMYSKNNFWLYKIDSFTFADGTVWTDETIREKYLNDFTTSGNDTMYGFEATDVFLSSTGNDSIYGNSGDDEYHWATGAGNDWYYDQTRNSNNNGSNGDTLIFDDLNVSDLSFDEGSSDSLIITNNTTLEALTLYRQLHSSEWIYGIENFQFVDGTAMSRSEIKDLTLNGITITGTAGDDVLHGQQKDNVMDGLDGNDSLFGGAGADTLIGGADDDILVGGAGDDILNGGAGDDSYLLELGDGVDTITEVSGFDVLEIGSGVVESDLTFVQVGNDLDIQIVSSGFLIKDFYSGDEGKVVEEIRFDDGSVFDLLSLLDQEFFGTNVAEHFAGGIGVDTVNYSNSSWGVVVDLENGTGGSRYNNTVDHLVYSVGDTYASIENVVGTDHSYGDTIYGDAGDNALYGYGGRDILEGGAGADYLNGGADWDYATYYRASESITLDLQNGIQTGDAAGDIFVSINGIKATAFDDILVMNTSTVEAYGRDGNDHITGSSVSNWLFGDDGNDTIYGGAGADSLVGGEGADILYGEDGLDFLWGEEGADTFVFEGASAYNNIDVVKDFSVADGDVLDLSNLLSTYDATTDAITDYVQITDNGTDSTVAVDADGVANGLNFVDVATIEGITGLTDEASLLASGNLVA